jgi:hypothetical protein
MKHFIIIAVFLSYACQQDNSKRILKENIPVIQLKCEKIKINEIIKPVSMVILNNYLIIQNERNAKTDCFYVYNFSGSVKFCFSFGTWGNGPGEFIAPRLIQNNKNNQLAVYDSASDIISIFTISDDTEVFIDKKQIETNRYYPIQEISYVNDSILLFSIECKDYNRLYCYNLRTDQLLDSLEYKSYFKDKLKERYNPLLDTYHFDNYNNEVVIANRFIDAISCDTLTENFRFRHPNKVLNASNFTPFSQKQLHENNLFYSYVSITSNYIFAQRLGLPFKVLQPFPLNMAGRNFKFVIEVFDKELNPVAVLEPDKDILRCLIDEKQKCIYTWDPLNDFDQILKYKYELP